MKSSARNMYLQIPQCLATQHALPDRGSGMWHQPGRRVHTLQLVQRTMTRNSLHGQSENGRTYKSGGSADDRVLAPQALYITTGQAGSQVPGFRVTRENTQQSCAREKIGTRG